jgi:uracil phosphoribosyltransferase
MTTIILDSENTILNVFLREIRDKTIQQDKQRFRDNMRKCGQILAFEISKTLTYHAEEITTPLSTKIHLLPENNIVLVCILRASLPFFDGFLDYFTSAESGFIGAFRKENTGSELEIQLDYQAFPKIDGKTVIIIDPMLATGKSMLKSINTILHLGKPKKMIVSSLICSEPGLTYLQANTNQNISFFSASKDPVLNDQFYIVPVLGDAGDLAFGVKE